jgi:hypothetical protein
MKVPYEGVASLAAAELFEQSTIEEQYYNLPEEDNYLYFDDEDYLEAYIDEMDAAYFALGFEEPVDEEYKAMRELELEQLSKPSKGPAAKRAPPTTTTMTRANATPEAALTRAAAAVLLSVEDS